MSDAATSDAGQTEGTEATEQQAGLDLAPIMERMDGIGSTIEQLRASLTPAEEAEAEEEFDYTSLFEDADAESPQFDPQAVQQMIQQEAQRLIEAQMAPMTEQIRNIQVGLDAEQLVAKYPDLNDDAVVGPVVQAAQALAEAVGDPSLAQNPQVVELIYKAQRADKQAAGERPVGAEQGFDLERAGGAGPAAVEPNIAERVITAAKSQNFWEHW